MSIPIHVALVDESGLFDPAELADIAGALNEQIADFRRYWRATPPATVGAYPGDPPPGTWAIRLRRELDAPGALGYHTDQHNQPYALVDADDGNVTQTISHELLEMLADPWGSRLHAARLPDALTGSYSRLGLAHPTSRVHYLVEVCDPCEATAYDTGGVSVSDFLTPLWYRTSPDPGAAMTYQRSCAAREIAHGGYVSFHVAGDWWQAFNTNGRLKLSHLGRFDRAEFQTIRTWTDHRALADGITNQPRRP